jgi:hypothetical protein
LSSAGAEGIRCCRAPGSREHRNRGRRMTPLPPVTIPDWAGRRRICCCRSHQHKKGPKTARPTLVDLWLGSFSAAVGSEVGGCPQAREVPRRCQRSRMAALPQSDELPPSASRTQRRSSGAEAFPSEDSAPLLLWPTHSAPPQARVLRPRGGTLDQRGGSCRPSERIVLVASGIQCYTGHHVEGLGQACRKVVKATR